MDHQGWQADLGPDLGQLMKQQGEPGALWARMIQLERQQELVEIADVRAGAAVRASAGAAAGHSSSHNGFTPAAVTGMCVWGGGVGGGKGRV